MNLKLALYGIAFVGGWLVNGWYHDSLELAKKDAADRAIEAFEARESSVTVSVEKKLSELRANERVRTLKVPEIIKQPQLIKVCLSDDAINSVNDAVNGLRDSGSDTER